MQRDQAIEEIQRYTDSLAANPAQPETLVRRGMVHHVMGDFVAAAADFTAALALNPNFPEAFNNRGVVRQAQGDHAGAIADFDESLRLRPNYAEACNNRGTARHALGDFAAAIADFDRAFALQPNYPEALNNRGAAKQRLRDLPGALADFDAAIRLQPRYAEAFDNRGGVHYLLWRHDQAIADFDQALRLYGTDAPPAVRCRLHVSRGDARYHSGSGDGLLADYRQAFRLDPDAAARLIVQRLARDIQANFNLLLANCDKHLRANPDDYISFARRGVVWLLAGHDDQAQRDLDLFYAKHPNNPLGVVRQLAEKAQEYRQRHGVVMPGNDPTLLPPQLGA
jgi:tetratricopeptide (TPR) repeat protein